MVLGNRQEFFAAQLLDQVSFCRHDFLNRFGLATQLTEPAVENLIRFVKIVRATQARLDR